MIFTNNKIVLSVMLSLAMAVTMNNAPLAFASHDGNMFKATLAGSKEVPPVSTSATGYAEFDVNESMTQLQYELNVQNGMNLTAGHIHCGLPGQNGPVVIGLFNFASPQTSTEYIKAGTVNASDILPAGQSCSDEIEDFADFLDAMEDGELYVNVHSSEHPNGLIRGQIHSVDDETNDDNEDNDDDVDDEDNEDDTIDKRFDQMRHRFDDFRMKFNRFGLIFS